MHQVCRAPVWRYSTHACCWRPSVGGDCGRGCDAREVRDAVRAAERAVGAIIARHTCDHARVRVRAAPISSKGGERLRLVGPGWVPRAALAHVRVVRRGRSRARPQARTAHGRCCLNRAPQCTPRRVVEDADSSGLARRLSRAELQPYGGSYVSPPCTRRDRGRVRARPVLHRVSGHLGDSV
jgi:hypothetical protein